MVCYSERKRWPILYLKKQSKAYLSLKDLTANIDNRPTVLSEKSSALRGMYHPEIVIWLILSRTPELIICLRIYRVPEVPLSV